MVTGKDQITQLLLSTLELGRSGFFNHMD